MKYLTSTETLRYLEDRYGMKYSKSALDKYRREGTGPQCVKLNGKLWYRDIDIDQWVRSATYVRHDNPDFKQAAGH